MTRRLTIVAVIAIAVLSPFLATWPETTHAQDERPVAVEAQVLPLATRSMMLDITRMADGRFVAVGERGHVIHSDDGVNWVQAEHVPSRATLTSVATTGERLWAAGHDTDILVSDDRGRNWTLLYRDIERQQPVLDLHFSDPQRGIAIGAYGLAMFTTDGGQSWDERLVSEDEWHLNAILDLGDDELFIAGESGISYASEDGGLSWTALEMPYPGSMFGAIQANGCLWLFGLRGHLQQRCTGADGWIEAETGVVATLLGGVGTADGVLLVGNSGTVLAVGADRQTQLIQHSSGVDFAAIVAAGDGRWLLAGEGGIHPYPEAAFASVLEEGSVP